MKKILATLLTLAMLLSMGAVMAYAGAEDISWTPGNYAVADASEFSPVGTVKITWDADASTKLDLSDGDMSDWAAANYPMITIDASNMVSWVGGKAGEVDPEMPTNWGMSTYFVADADYLYIGFYVTDDDFVHAAAAAGYGGDAFQVCIDFGGKLGDAVREDPDSLTNPKNIFYSFACVEDGKALEIQLQESDQDGMLSEANEDGVKGAARATETGWSAEFALSWEMLYDHYSWKVYDDPTIYVGGDDNAPLKIGCALYYLNRDTNEDGSASGVTWAAGTSNGYTMADGTPGVSWTCYDNGIQLELDITDEVSFNTEYIKILAVGETTPEEEETTAAPVEDTTAAPDTSAPETTVAEDDTTVADETTVAEDTTATESDSCSTVVGMGAAVAVMAAAAAAVALKKKD